MTWGLRANARLMIRRQGGLGAGLAVLSLLLALRDTSLMLVALGAAVHALWVVFRSRAVSVRIEDGIVVVTNGLSTERILLGDVESVAVEARPLWGSTAHVAIHTARRRVFVDAARWQEESPQAVAEEIRDALRKSGALIR